MPTPSVQEMQADLRTALAHGDTALAQHIHGLIQAQRQQSGAISDGPDLGQIGNSLMAADIHFTHQIPFVGDAAMTAGRWAGHALNGQPVSWQQANDEVHQSLQSAQQQHPIASTAGGVAGGTASAVLGGELLKGASGGEAVLQALPKATTTVQRLANAGRVAAAGGLAGATQQGLQQGGEQLARGDIAAVPGATGQGALVGGAAGAVLGPVAGAAATGVKKAFAPLATKTAVALSKVFGENAADLQAAWQTFTQNTGRAPTMAELAALKQTGAVRDAAKGSTEISAQLTQAAEDAARARSTSMQTTFGSAPAPGPQAAFTPAEGAPEVTLPNGKPAPEVQSSLQTENAKTAQGDIDYPAARQHDFNISTDESDELGGVSPADHLAAEVLPQAGLGKADRLRIVNGLQSGVLSGQDAQLIRSGLSESLSRNYSPAVKGYLSDLESILSAPGNEAADKALNTATSNYAAAAQRQAGAAHGETILGSQTADNYAAEAASKPNANANFPAGQAAGARSKLADQAATPRGALSLAERLKDDDALHAKLATTFGSDAADALRRLGESETEAAKNLQPFTNRTPPSDDQNSKDLGVAMRALAATASHGVYKLYHASKVFGGLGLSPQVQEKVAQYLADPKMVGQGINLLRKAGATNAQLRQLAIQAASATGAAGAGAVSSATEQ